MSEWCEATNSGVDFRRGWRGGLNLAASVRAKSSSPRSEHELLSDVLIPGLRAGRKSGLFGRQQ